MMSYRRGDVVIMNYPHSDLVHYKRRPAIVVQADGLQTGIAQTILVLITTNQGYTGPTRIAVKRSSRAGRRMGLKKDSVILTDNIVTVLEQELETRIGYCPDMPIIDQALRVTLGL